MEEVQTQKKSRLWLGRAATGIGLVLCILFGFLLICNLTIIVKGTLYPEKPPSVLGVTPMVVLSGSMSGTQEGHIEIGDLIFVGPADPEALQTGDVIAFMSGNSSVTHRIVGIETAEDGSLLFTTRGDANTGEDTEPVTEDQIIGVYWGRLPQVGNFALFLQKPLGMLLFIGVPVLAFIIYDIIRRQKYANQEKKKTQALEEELARLRSQAEQSPASPEDTSPQ